MTYLGHRRARRPRRPDEPILFERNPQLLAVRTVPAKARHRQRIEHLVGEDDSVKSRAGRHLEPLDALLKMRHALPHEAALALAQIGAHLENPIACRQSPERFEPRQHIHREASAAGADFQDRPLAQFAQHIGALLRHAGAEQP